MFYAEKVFKKLKFQIHTNDIMNIITAAPGYVEKVLYVIYCKIKRHQEEH